MTVGTNCRIKYFLDHSKVFQNNKVLKIPLLQLVTTKIGRESLKQGKLRAIFTLRRHVVIENEMHS